MFFIYCALPGICGIIIIEIEVTKEVNKNESTNDYAERWRGVRLRSRRVRSNDIVWPRSLVARRDDRLMFIEHNQNPYGDNIDDCVVRAISLVLELPYWQVFDELCEEMDKQGADIINGFNVLVPYLNSKGYEIREATDKMTVKQFATKCKQCYDADEIRWLLLVNGHMTTCIAEDIYDTWNCLRYKVQYIIVPCE